VFRVHPFHRMLRRNAVLSGLVGVMALAFALANETTGLLGADGSTLLLVIAGTLLLLGALELWLLQRMPLLEHPRPRTRRSLLMAAAVVVAAAAIGGYVSYLFSGLFTGLFVGGLALVAGIIGLVLGERSVDRWSSPQ
jgi:hypothetical protein